MQEADVPQPCGQGARCYSSNRLNRFHAATTLTTIEGPLALRAPSAPTTAQARLTAGFFADGTFERCTMIP